MTGPSTAARSIGSGLEAAENCAGLGFNVSHCADEVSCRLFLCGRCRSRVLVCRDCDRGQIYCFGTCAQDARRENQREARRRYQATPRGRAMHAARSRRYRARGQCVTDHSPPNEQKAGPFLELEVGEALSERSRSRRSPLQWLCHHCRRSASQFVRLSPFRPRHNRRKTDLLISDGCDWSGVIAKLFAKSMRPTRKQGDGERYEAESRGFWDDGWVRGVRSFSSPRRERPFHAPASSADVSDRRDPHHQRIGV